MLAIALVFTAGATILASRAAATREEVEFTAAVEETQQRLASRLETYVSLLRATQGLFMASETVTATEFSAFAGTLNVQEHFPGIQGIAWCQRVTAAGKDQLVSEVRALGRPGFAVWPESPARDEYMPILYIEPLDRRNQAAIGFDVATEAVRRQALHRARDTGEVTASGSVVLVQEIDAEKQAGFLVINPVYRPGRPLRSVEERRAALAGYVTAIFRIGDLVRSVVQGSPHRIEFSIHEGTEAAALEFYHTTGMRSASPPRATRQLLVCGREWVVRYSPAAVAVHQRLVLGILFGGLLASALLAFGAGTLARSRARAERAAAELRISEAALRDREARLRFLAEASSVLTASLDHEATLATLARLIVPAVADWCAIDLADDHGGLRRLVVVHTNPAKIALAELLHRTYPPRPNEGALKVLSEGRSAFHPTLDDALLVSFARDDEHLRLLRGLGLRAVIQVPLSMRGRVLGVLTLVMAESQRRYDQGDLAFAEDLAQRSAGAVDNALLFEAEHRARSLAEEARRQVAQQAEELGRSNAELEQFAYVASHDLQEPLRMVSSYLDLLVRRASDRLDERARGYVDFATDGARRMQELIKDLLAYSRAGRVERADLVRIPASRALAEALENLRSRSTEVGATITAGDLPAVVFDKIQLVQVFQNLIGNALKFRGEKAPVVEVTAERLDGAWVFAVQDNGIGIDPNYHARIFDIFQRLHSRAEYPGTGIGLAICKRIIERHGGRIWVESAPGQGAVFKWTVPE